jgi:uncharacterized protein
VSGSLPDVNVLVALAWPNHVHHVAANRWFESLGDQAWATCPITQSGFIRVSANPRIVDSAVSPSEAQEVLRGLTKLGTHQFWADEVDFTSPDVSMRLVMGYRQVTDAYLLALVTSRDGKLVTLDRAIVDLLRAKSPERKRIETLQP